MAQDDISFTVYKGDKSGAIHSATTTKPALSKDQVHVRVTASGVCGTDLHYVKNSIALGHEGVGIVEAVGPDATHLKKGDRVGWGYETDACGQCKQCLTGTETYCPERKLYGYANTDVGSFASAAVLREAFLYKLPDDMSDAVAAPLMCGGATVFEALHGHPARSTDRVGIVGVGGLGHLAIQFAAKMGCEVVVFSGSDSKRDEATRLGAKEFHALKDEKDLSKTTAPVNRLLVTSSALPDWKQLLPVLAPGAQIFPLSVDMGDFRFPYLPLLQNGIRVQGSLVAPRHVVRDMLDFAARHKIEPVIMEFGLDERGIEKALKTLTDGEMRYRGVLVPGKKGEKL
ncbi:hypothetical protein ANO11243_090410 [Dothideomycetidae sp. 11243]|nr:hypothetical protein ANO11243_090410 [fungal sp. No.11243]